MYFNLLFSNMLGSPVSITLTSYVDQPSLTWGPQDVLSTSTCNSPKPAWPMVKVMGVAIL